MKLSTMSFVISRKLLLVIIILLSIVNTHAQCNAATSIGSSAISIDGSENITSAMQNNQYYTFTGLNIGDTYQAYSVIGYTAFTGHLTIRNSSDNSIVTHGNIGNGVTPLEFTATTTSVEFHTFATASCSGFTIIPSVLKKVNDAITWSGATNTDWDTASNWDGGNAPNASDDIIIPNVTNKPIIGVSSNAVANNVTINGSSSLEIKSGGRLTVNGDLTINSTLIINSGASLLVVGSSSGTHSINYKRTMSTTNWYLLSSPLAGETIEDLISGHTFATGSGSNIGLASYRNNGSGWNYQTTASTGSLTSGIGYAIKLASTGNLSIFGTMPTSDVGVSITSNTNGFNLIGNPYPSYLPANNSADGNSSNNDDILSVNSSSLTEETIWFWDQSANGGTGGYTQVNQASSGRYIAPTQGFFVSSNGSNTFNFTETMQSHQSTDSFQKSRNESLRTKLILSLTDGNSFRDTNIYYIEGTTTGWDNGYDSSIFDGISNSFAIYTHVVSNGEGRKLGIQSLPNNNFDKMIIPVGINASSKSTITLSSRALNLPNDIKVYLEDKQSNTFTLLNNFSNYTTTLVESLNGIGRFYIHTTPSTLNIDKNNIENVSIYTQQGNLRIVGVQNDKVTINIYDLLGKKVLSSFFRGNGLNDLRLPNLTKGVYIVKLNTETEILSKKIIIQ